MKVQLNSQVDADLQRRLKVYAARTGMKLQDAVAEALVGYLPPEDVTAEGDPSLSASAAPAQERRGRRYRTNPSPTATPEQQTAAAVS